MKITTNSPQLFLSALLLFLLLIMDIITRSLHSRGSNNQLRSTDLFRSMIIKNNKSIVVMTYPYPLAPPSSPPLSLEVDLDQSEACLVHSVRGVKNLGNGWSKSFFFVNKVVFNFDLTRYDSSRYSSASSRYGDTGSRSYNCPDDMITSYMWMWAWPDDTS